MAIHHCSDNLYLIDLDLPLEGFRKFISSWLYKSPGLNVLVDPGPSATIPELLTRLKELSVGRLDYILLTHIHADHAGGIGLFAKHYPDARIICHRQGIRHMIDPGKLWEGTQKTLGDVAKAYGEIVGVSADSIGFEDRIHHGNHVIESFETPGHAAHHLCFRLGDILFAGEVAGTTYPFDNGDLYIRPATPPVFDYEIYSGSLKKAAALDASLICFAHYGCRTDKETFFSPALDQLANWLAVVKEHIDKDKNAAEESIFADILKRDPYVSRYHELPVDVQARDRFFSLNSIRGMREYLMRKK